MEKKFEIIKKTRIKLLDIISDLTTEQLNQIPTGFNNNIIWNFGHLIAAQQGVCYKRANLPLNIDENYFNTYKPETKPERPIDENEIAQLKQLFLPTINKLETDCKNNLFANYPAWSTRYGIEIANIQDAVNFILFHDGIHGGYIMALKRVVRG